MIGLGAFWVLLWLATPAHSEAYQELPTEDTDTMKPSLDRISVISSTGKGDEEEFHCGWVYLTFEYHDVVPINLLVLQEMRGTARPMGVYFMILHRSSLFLYDSEAQETCLGVSNLEGFLVDIFPHSLLLDEIYRKDFPVRISNPNGQILGSSSPSCFVYAANASEKEDWLGALRRASGGISLEVQKERDHLDFDGFMRGFETNLKGVESEDGTGKLLSALLSRVMFNIHKAAEVEVLIREKFIKRTETLPKPFFMGDLVLEEVDIGRNGPIFTDGRLHSVSHHGELVGSLDILYPGGLTMKISTQVTSPVVVPITVSVAVKKLAGRVMLKVKGPPSDRIWFGFYRIPDYEISVEPVVSSVAITWSFVQKAIMKKIEEGLLEYFVLPNMDEILIPPLVSGTLFVGERPFELEPVPPPAIAKIVDKEAYSAEGLSRRSPSLVSFTELTNEDRKSVENILVHGGSGSVSTGSSSGVPSRPDSPAGSLNRRIFLSLSENQLAAAREGRPSPLLEGLIGEEQATLKRTEAPIEPEHEHVD